MEVRIGLEAGPPNGLEFWFLAPSPIVQVSGTLVPQERSRTRTAERVDCGYLALLIYFIERFGNFVSARKQIKFGAWKTGLALSVFDNTFALRSQFWDRGADPFLHHTFNRMLNFRRLNVSTSAAFCSA